MTSAFGDSGSAVVIIIIFSLVHILLAVSIGITNIRKNWEKYKCDPAIMPFAGVFGHDVTENFNQCIKTTQVDFMGPFLEPVYQSLSYFSQNGAQFTDMFEDLKVGCCCVHTLLVQFYQQQICWCHPQRWQTIPS